MTYDPGGLEWHRTVVPAMPTMNTASQSTYTGVDPRAKWAWHLCPSCTFINVMPWCQTMRMRRLPTGV